MARNAKPASDKLLSRRVLVNIKRDMTTSTPTVIWQHEIPVLQAMFGEDEVTVLDPATLDEGYRPKPAPEMLVHNKNQEQIPKPSESQGIGFVFVGSPDVEYQRLAAAYGWHPEIKVTMVEHVYGRFQEGRFTDVVGQAELSDLPAAQLIDLIKSYGYLPEVGFDANKEEKEAAAKARRELLAKPQEALVKIAEEVGVTIA